MKEKTICIVTPEGRAYYKAALLAKEFFDKDHNVIHTTGTLPDGELEEISVSALTRKTLKNGKLDGKLEVVTLADNKITFSEEYKDGVLVSVTDGAELPPITKPEKKQTYPGTVLKTHNGAYSFYRNGKEIAEATVSANGTTLEVLGTIPDGDVKEFNENGQVILEAVYRNNKPNGELKRYNDAGQLISQETYVDGVLNGPAQYFQYQQEEKTRTDCEYKNAQLHGRRVMYYPDGKIKAEENFRYGKLRGPRTTYYHNGKIDAQEHFLDGKMTGERILHSPQGHIWYREHYKSGRLDGDRCAYFPSGAIRLEEFYADGLLEGARKIFTESGELLSTEEYHWGTLVRNTERN